MTRLARWLQRRWYGGSAPLLLRPLAALYGGISSRLAARKRAQAVRLPVPVIVVGNISVGGTGKTPLVTWLVEELRARGLRPGVISRGYGGRAPVYPLRVTAQTDAALCGDEPALLARRLGVPLSVAPDRVAAAQQLIASDGVDVIVSDDGLQHYRLARDAEICVVDGARGLGNGGLLPAGPLREPPSRLASVGLVVVNGGGWRPAQALGVPVADMQLQLGEAQNLRSGERRALHVFAGRPLHALAGIGHPERFFAALRAQGLQPTVHAFADHHAYTAADLAFGDGLPVLMTEKDAVKCASFAQADAWCVPVTARFEPETTALVRKWLDSILDTARSR